MLAANEKEERWRARGTKKKIPLHRLKFAQVEKRGGNEGKAKGSTNGSGRGGR